MSQKVKVVVAVDVVSLILEDEAGNEETRRMSGKREQSRCEQLKS
jgi:hypothetical protein